VAEPPGAGEPLGLAEAPWSMDGAALGSGAPLAAAGAWLGPYDHAGRDEAGVQATMPMATRPPPATAALWRNPRRLTARRSGVVAPLENADPVWSGEGRLSVVSMRGMVC
jgi:hypothetical protein